MAGNHTDLGKKGTTVYKYSGDHDFFYSFSSFTPNGVGGDGGFILSLNPGPEGNSRLAGLIFDISGHGEEAYQHSLDILKLTESFRKNTKVRKPEVRNLMSSLNNYFLDSARKNPRNPCPVFGVGTGFCISYNWEFGFYSAGFPLPVIYNLKGNRRNENFEKPGIALGFAPEKKFSEELPFSQTLIYPGERILMYTDGLTELPVKNGRWSLNGLDSFLDETLKADAEKAEKNSHQSRPEELTQEILEEALRIHDPRQGGLDDISVLAIQRR